jgi:hypothetical protein
VENNQKAEKCTRHVFFCDEDCLFLLVCRLNWEDTQTHQRIEKKKWFGKQWRGGVLEVHTHIKHTTPAHYQEKKKKTNRLDETKQNNNYYRNKGQGVKDTSFGGLVRPRRRSGKEQMRKEKKRAKRKQHAKN